MLLRNEILHVYDDTIQFLKNKENFILSIFYQFLNLFHIFVVMILIHFFFVFLKSMVILTPMIRYCYRFYLKLYFK